MDSGVETQTCTALRQEIERSLRRAFDPADVLPRLARLARLAPAASDDGVFAHRQLAELLVERHPWRAAIYARRALAHREDDDRAWAVLAFCQTLLGNFRCAATAYEQAIASAPANPWYAHNLGHLLDVALGAPHRALPWLRSAYGKKGDNSEIVASYVHALARAGQTGEARGVLERALERFDSRELEALLRWLDQGAPSRADAQAGARGAPAPDGSPSRRAGRTRAARQAGPANPAAAPRSAAASRASTPSTRSTPSKPSAPFTPSHEPAALRLERVARGGRGGRALARVLERGLAHLPFDKRQRARALALAHDALTAKLAAAKNAATEDRTASAPRVKRKNDDVAGLAAAVAYAIVYVDHVPLSQAEVAAPFRVAVGRLRGRFAELRAKLDIIPGDVRYASRGG